MKINKVCLILWLLALTATVLGSQAKKPATQPSTRPQVFVGVKWMLLFVPDPVYPALGKQWTQMKAELANSSFKDVVGKETVLTFKVHQVGHGGTTAGEFDDQNSYWVLSEDVGCGTWKIGVVCHFNESEKGLLAAINVDDSVRAQGPVTRCELVEDSHHGWTLHVELGPCRIVH